MAYKTVNSLSSTDAAYIAGLVDGEGSVGGHRNDERQLVVSGQESGTHKIHCMLRHSE